MGETTKCNGPLHLFYIHNTHKQLWKYYNPCVLPEADGGPSPGGCCGGTPRAGSGWCRCRCVCACACVCVWAAAAAAATAADWCIPAICSRIMGSAAMAMRCSDCSHSADRRSAIAGSTIHKPGFYCTHTRVVPKIVLQTTMPKNKRLDEKTDMLKFQSNQLRGGDCTHDTMFTIIEILGLNLYI